MKMQAEKTEAFEVEETCYNCYHYVYLDVSWATVGMGFECALGENVLEEVGCDRWENEAKEDEETP